MFNGAVAAKISSILFTDTSFTKTYLNQNFDVKMSKF